MKSTSVEKGYYSVVQYCPDPSRMEGANIGVILFTLSGGVKILTDEGVKRVEKFFGSDHTTLAQSSSCALRERLKREDFSSLLELNNFINSRANLIHLTPLRPMKVQHFDQDAQELFEKLVKT